MTTKTDTYRDYAITVTTVERGEGRYEWEYLIDGQYRTTSNGRACPTADVAYADAWGQATVRVDQFIWQDTRSS